MSASTTATTATTTIAQTSHHISTVRYWYFVFPPLLFSVLAFGLYVLFRQSSFQRAPALAFRKSVYNLPRLNIKPVF